MTVDADEEVEQWACGGRQAWPERRRGCTLYLASQGPIGGAIQHAAWERPALECACGGVAALTRRASRASAAAGVGLGRDAENFGLGRESIAVCYLRLSTTKLLLPTDSSQLGSFFYLGKPRCIRHESQGQVVECGGLLA